MENGRANLPGNSGGERRHGGVAQDQNGGGDIGLPQLQRLQNGGNAEESAVAFQSLGHFHGAVAVGVGLDDRQDHGPGLFGNGREIVQHGVQVDFHIGGVQIS